MPGTPIGEPKRTENGCERSTAHGRDGQAQEPPRVAQDPGSRSVAEAPGEHRGNAERAKDPGRGQAERAR